MDARSYRGLLRGLVATSLFALIVAGNTSSCFGQRGAPPKYTANSQNFIVFASSPAWAAEVSRAAEKYRSELGQYWLGTELPPWSERCPLHVHDGPRMQASGETQYALMGGRAGAWGMSVQGTKQRILDSVLPHEITHTIFATHFGPMNKYVPRWADEGACTTVEHESEKQKHRSHLQRYLRTGRGLAFNHMFRLKEYPNDILPLYAQGHSAVQFLIDQAGPQKFVEFIGIGMRTESWPGALKQVYAYDSIGQFQTLWNKWLADGSPVDKISYSPLLQSRSVSLASATRPLGQAGERDSGPQMLSIHSQSPLASVSQVPQDDSGSDVSWYQQRLTQVTGELPPRYDGRPKTSGKHPLMHSPAPVRSARPSEPRRPGIQVLDWGNAPPVSGIQRHPNGQAMFR